MRYKYYFYEGSGAPLYRYSRKTGWQFASDCNKKHHWVDVDWPRRRIMKPVSYKEMVKYFSY